jgi:hypothetical protein
MDRDGTRLGADESTVGVAGVGAALASGAADEARPLGEGVGVEPQATRTRGNRRYRRMESSRKA